MRMEMHNRLAAKRERAAVTSPHWWDDKRLVTGKYEKDDFVARVLDHLADQYDGPVGRNRRHEDFSEWEPIWSRTCPRPQIPEDYRWEVQLLTMKTA